MLTIIMGVIKMSDKNKSKKVVGNQKIICSVTDCVHNCVSDCTCRLETIKVNVMEDKARAETKDGTACKSYDYCGDLNESEILGGN